MAIGASVYLSILGPRGLAELSTLISERTHYAQQKLSRLTGVRAPCFQSFHFMEFTVNFDKTGKKVSEINEALLTAGIQGGLDLSTIFPNLGQTALYCFTEVHSHEDVDMLVEKLQDILGGT